MSTFHEHRLLRKTIQDLNALRLKGNPREKPIQGPLVLPGTSNVKATRRTGSVVGKTAPILSGGLPGKTPGGSTIIGTSPRAAQQNAARQQTAYQTNLAKNAATVKSGLTDQAIPTINVETPGGTIGYDANLYDPVVDENGTPIVNENGNYVGVTQKTNAAQPTQPTNPVRTLVDRGMFKQSEANPTKLVLDESKVNQKVQERRNQRLIDMGIDPNHEAVKLIEQGGLYDGTDAQGTPYIKMPDGSRVQVQGYSGAKIQDLSKNKDQIEEATITKEVKDEFKDTYTGTDSSVGGTSQGQTQGMTGDITSTDMATKAGLGTKYDLTPFNNTKTSITDLQAQVKNLSPDLQAAIMPSLLALQSNSDLAMSTASALISSMPTDQEITSRYGSLEQYIIDQDTKYKDILEKNKQQSLAVANYNRDALELEKKLNDHNAYVAEQQQAQKNIETEKALRRQVNKLGIQTDTSGLDYLNTEIQKGIDALNNLKTANNLVSLRAQLAIGEGYKLDVKNALNTYEGNYLQITSQTTEALRSVKNDIAMKIEERDKEIRSILKDAIDKKGKNDADAADKIYNANIEMIKQKNDEEKRKADVKKEARDSLQWLISTYGSKADPLAIQKYTDILGEDADWYSTMTSAEIKAANGEQPSPFQVAQMQISLGEQFRSSAIYKSHTTIEKSYSQISGSVEESNRIVKDIAAGKATKDSLLGSDINMMYSFIKMMDDTSAVREGELELLEDGQSWGTYIRGQIAKANRDGTTLTPEQRNSILKQAESIRQYVGAKYQEHVSNTAATIEDLNMRLGIGINAKSVLGPDYFPGGADAADKIMDDEPNQSTEPNQSRATALTKPIGKIYASLGKVTQNYNTPISDTKHGGLYEDTTVKALGGKHAGIDIAMKSGTPVKFPISGEVIESAYEPGWGGTIVIKDQNGGLHRFSHLSDIKVFKGMVSPGSIIALSGGGEQDYGHGNSTGPHLDYRIKVNGKYVDPLTYTI